MEAPQPTTPIPPRSSDDRRSYRTLLLFLLMLTVAVWAWQEHRKPMPAVHNGPFLGPQPHSEVVDHDGQQIREVWDLPFTYHPGVPLEEMAMDLFIPEGARDCPVLIYCHGGGWMGGNKNGIGPKSIYFASRGVLVASVGYRLCDVRPGRNGATDIADAIRFLHREIGPLGGDPNRIFVMGHSAGAHLAALAVCDPALLAKDPAAAAAIRGVILLDGSAYDIPALMTSEKAEDFEIAFGRSSSDWLAVSPYHLALARKGLPSTLLVHAGNEPVRQASAQHLAAALRQGGSKATLVSMPNRDHYGVDTSIGQADDGLTPIINKFIKTNGKGD